MIVRVVCRACRHSMMAEAREAYQIGVRCDNPGCHEIIRTHQPSEAARRRLINPVTLAILAVVLVAGATFGIVRVFLPHREPSPAETVEPQEGKRDEAPATRPSAANREREATLSLWREIGILDRSAPIETDYRYAEFVASRYRSLSSVDVDPMLSDWVSEMVKVSRAIVDARAAFDRELIRTRAAADENQTEAAFTGGAAGFDWRESFETNVVRTVAGAVAGGARSRIATKKRLDRLRQDLEISEETALDRLDRVRRSRRTEVEPFLRAKFGSFD